MTEYALKYKCLLFFVYLMCLDDNKYPSNILNENLYNNLKERNHVIHPFTNLNLNIILSLIKRKVICMRCIKP